MYAVDPGYKYQLTDGQEVRFVKKERNPKSGAFETVWTGTTNEELLEVLIDRTRNLNVKLPSTENEHAIHHMICALEMFKYRTNLRVQQGVEGTPNLHVVPNDQLKNPAHHKEFTVTELHNRNKNA